MSSLEKHSAKLPSEFSYGNPALNLVGSGANRSLVRFFPSTNSNYTVSSAGGDPSRIVFDISDNDAFLLSDKGYLSFTVQPNIASTTVTNSPSGLGGALFSRIVLSAGGVILDDIQGYNRLDSITNLKSPVMQQTFLTNTCSFSPTQSTQASLQGTSVANSGVNVCHVIKSGFLMSEQAVPLPIIRAPALRIELYLDTFGKNFYDSAGTCTGITISNLVYNCEVVKSAPLLTSVYNQIQQGKSIVLPYIQTNLCNQINAIASTTNVVNSNVGYDVSSLNNLITTYQTSANQANMSSTIFPLSTFSYGTIASYYWKIGSKVYPSAQPIQVLDANNKWNPESLMRSVYGSQDFDDFRASFSKSVFANNAFSIEMNSKLSNLNLADGLDVSGSNGTISLYITSNSALSTGDMFLTWSQVATKLVISASEISVYKTFNSLA